MRIYLHNTGPLIAYDGRDLQIEDLNPEQKMKWRISRFSLIRIGFACLVAAVWAWEAWDNARKPAEPDVRGWRKHDGGPCPVPPDTLVELPGNTHSHGMMIGPVKASDVEWEHTKTVLKGDEIRFYRIRDDG